MKDGRRILALIAARGGSRGLPGKNLRPLGGRPLIHYSIRPAVESRHVDRVVVTTDSPEIAEIARACGAEVPFLRSPELSGDKADLMSVNYDCLDRLYTSEGYEAEILIRMMPTYPFKTTRDLDRLLEDILVHRAECTTFAHCMDSSDLQDYCVVDRFGRVNPIEISPADRAHSWFFSNNSILIRTMPPWGLLHPYQDPDERDRAMGGYFLRQRLEGVTSGRSIVHHVDPIRGIDINVARDLSIAETVLSEGLFDFDGVFDETCH
jgi:CMP-N-acetylneuraminic acid synthetase